jgi:HEAT repeat protein
MTRLERSLLGATLALVGVGAGVWIGLRSLRGGPSDGGVAVTGAPPGTIPTPPRPAAPGVIPDGGEPDDSALAVAPGSTGIPAGLRRPDGIDFSDPVVVQNALREQLAVENPRWDWIADLVAKVSKLDPDLKNALLNELLYHNAAGAIQALERAQDGTLVADLLHALDDPKLDEHDRGNVLLAVSGIPGADLREAVTGIEARLTGEFAHDGGYLRAIARLGGVEAARALVDAVNASRDPTAFGPDVWRAFDLRKSKDAADYLARALRDAPRSEAAAVALLDLAGRPGATEDLVTSMLALDAPEQKEPIRRAALAALAKTGDDAALARLVETAERQADYASVAARAIAYTDSISEPARGKLIETAQKTGNDYLRQSIVEALGNVKAATAVPLLTELLQNGSDLVRKESARALGRIGPASAPAVDALAAAYGAGDEALRQHAILALAQIPTPEAEGVVERARATEASPIVKKTIEAAWRAIQARRAREGK